MPPPAQHRSKRPFQPAITSYFHAAHDQDSDDPSDLDDDYRGGPRLRSIPQPRPHHASLAPTVPDAVQSNLLSVGMRVRKSVPEGYKVPKPLPSFAPSAPTPLRKPHAAYRDVHPALEIPHDALAPALTHARELLPFCGLNKIGGYAEQPHTNLVFPGNAVTNANTPFSTQSFSQPFSSQDSGYGTDAPRRGKRAFDDAALHVPPASFFFDIRNELRGEDDVPVSPLSESPPPSLPPQRTYAQPRSRRTGRLVTGGGVGVMDMDMDVDVDMDVSDVDAARGRVAAGVASDFEDADWLDDSVARA